MPLANQYSNVSPGTYISELDLTSRIQVAVSTTGAQVFASNRGTLTPYFTPSIERHVDMYGKSDPTISFGHDAAHAFLKRSSQLWGVRVVNGALHAGSTYLVDRNSKEAAALDAGERILNYKFPIGRANGYESGARDLVVIALDDDLVSLNEFDLSITDGATSVDITTVTYTTSHNNTMSLIAASISTAMGSFGSDGYVAVIPESATGTLNNHVILVYPPTTTTLTFSGAAVTSGASQAGVAIDTEARLMEIFAENPGDWADDVGTKITNVDVGIRQRWRLTIGAALTVDHSLQAYVNNTLIGPVAFNTDSDTTLDDFATALAANADISSATVETVAGAVNNDRSIVVVAEVAAPDALSITGFAATGTNAPATVTQETLKGVTPNYEFDLEVYDRSNVVLPVERYRSTLAKRVNGKGEQTAVDYIFNDLAKSLNIRVIVPDYARTYLMKPDLIGSVYSIDANIRFMSGGDDGALPLNSQIIAGWDLFKDRQKIPVRLLINSGYVDPSVQQKMIEIAEYRHDAFAILDMPSASQTAQAAYDYRLQTINIDSSFGALYTPDLLIQDESSDELRYIPPSGHVAAVYAFNDASSAVFYAPAGHIRGKLQGVRELRVDYELGDRELLNPIGVNCIVDFNGSGPTVWGEETLQWRKTVLSAVHSRRLLNMIVVAYADALDYSTLFEPNTAFTRFKARQIGEKLLAPIKNEGGLLGYEVVCDTTNNSPESMEQEILRVDIYLKITPTVKRILLRAVLTPLGASFAETIRYVNGDAIAA